MKTRSLFLFLLLLTSVLLGCTTKIVSPIPSINQTATQTIIIVVSSEPSNTATWTIIPETVTPSPSPTLTITASPESTQYPPTPQQACNSGELDTYIRVWDPTITKLIILAREVGQLEELSNTRAKEIIAETAIIDIALDEMSVPSCLDYSHERSFNAINLLESSISLLLEEDFDKARKDLEGSFEEIVRAVTFIGYLMIQETETSTPDQ